MPTERELRRHHLIPPTEKDKLRTQMTANPKLHRPRTTYQFIHRRHQPLHPIERCRMVHPTLRHARETDRHQTKPTKNTTPHRPHPTPVHTTENYTGTPCNDLTPRQHSRRRMHPPRTSHRHTHVRIPIHDRTSKQIPNNSK